LHGGRIEKQHLFQLTLAQFTAEKVAVEITGLLSEVHVGETVGIERLRDPQKMEDHLRIRHAPSEEEARKEVDAALFRTGKPNAILI
jgi:hypothetical protein